MKKCIALLLCLLTVGSSLIAQNVASKTLKGKVIDDSTGAGLPDATVIVAKKNYKTDASGNFSIKVTDEGKKFSITVSYAGYQAAQLTTDGSGDISIRLKKDINQIEDVVVIGYQTVKRKDVLASVASVGAKELKDIPINSAAEALNGRLAGVTATAAEGSPDAQVNIRVRGGMSITGDNSPLYIIDGVQVENGLSTISPQDIQNIDVLKDAAATAIYGARGANGVVIITTKSGKVGKLKVAYNGFVGVKTLPKTLGVLSPYDYVFYQSERSRLGVPSSSSNDSTTFLKNFGTTWDTLAFYKLANPVDWQRETLGQTGFTSTQNVTASGGNKKTVYTFGYTFNNDKAIVRYSSYQRHLLNLKIDQKINSKMKVGISARYNHQEVFGAGVSDEKGSAYSRLRNSVKYRPFLSAGQDIDDTDPLADPAVGNGLSLINPIQLTDAEYRKRSTDAYNLTANFSYTITKNLTFKSTFGYDRNDLVDRQFLDSISPFSNIQGGKKPVVQLDTTNRQTITNSNVLTYSIKNFKRKHNFDFLVGEETYDLRTQTYSGLYRDFPNFTRQDVAFSETTNLGIYFNGYPKVRKTRYTSLSFFSRLNYSYMNKYLFTFNLRADGASKFSPNNRWGYFPAGSFAWRVKNESFLKDVKFISDLKFRAGFGTVGNNRIDDYQYITTFFNDGRYFYGINNQSVFAFYPNALVNENLRWESTLNRNFGVDISLFKNKIDLSVDIYNNSSRDLLLYVPIAPTFGYTQQYQNIGRTSNKGVEVQLNATILRKPKNNLSWTANFNISFNRNRIEELGLGQNSFFPPASWGVSGQQADYNIRIGGPVGSMWGLVTDGFYTVNDFDYNTTTRAYTLKAGVVTNVGIIGPVQPGSIKFKDLNGDGKIDMDNDRTIIGNPTPKFTGGLNQQITYKNWDFSVFVNFSYGNDVYNANKIEFTNGYTPNSNILSVMQDRWKVVTPTGQTAQWVNGGVVYGIAPDELSALNADAKIWQPLRSSGAFVTHSWAIEDGSFLRVNNMTLGYSLPVKTLVKMGISKLRFYVTGNNLALLTSYTGYDPEVSVRKSPLTPGLDYSAYPRSRTYIFGVNVIF
jgi:TonB-linked SusC/RagA family outer membrane protein